MKLSISILLLFCALGSAQYLPHRRQAFQPVAAEGAWTPQSPANTLREWLRNTDLTGADGDQVTTWTAAVGRNLTGTGTTSATNRTSGPNSRRYIEFDGVDDTMATAAFASSQAQPYTLAIVCRTRVFDTGSNKYLLDGIDSGARAGLLHWAADSGTLSHFFGGTITSSLNNGTRATNAWRFGLIEVDNTSTRVAFDNAAYTAIDATAPGTHAMSGLTLGSAFNGTVNGPSDWIEVVVWDGKLGASDFQSATNYFNSLIR